jgi:hypothetical protein
MKNKYWVIDLDYACCSEERREAMGPFDSVAAAEKWIVDDCLETFFASDSINLGENPDWSGRLAIVKEIKQLKPTPVVSCKIELQ